MNILLSFIIALIIFSTGVHAENQAVVKLPDSSVYEGEIENGLFNGKGKLTWSNGAKYVGEFKDGLMHGEGEIKFADGSKYKGSFNNGLLHGKGVLKYVNGGKYEGEFVNDLEHGQGVLVFSNGDVYEGEFSQGHINGRGEMKYSNGDVYAGAFFNGQPHGEGKFTFESGEKYTGSFKDSMFHGHGVWRSADGEEQYVGEFKNGNFHSEDILPTKDKLTNKDQNTDAEGHAEALYKICKSDIQSSRDSCQFFLEGGTLMLQLISLLIYEERTDRANMACIPHPKPHSAELREMYLNYLDSNADLMQKEAHLVLTLLLREKYPCKL